MKALEIYLRGEATTNNVLGFEPIAYNRKSNKFFKHPFGQLSIGFVFHLQNNQHTKKGLAAPFHLTTAITALGRK